MIIRKREQMGIATANLPAAQGISGTAVVGEVVERWPRDRGCVLGELSGLGPAAALAFRVTRRRVDVDIEQRCHNRCHLVRTAARKQ